MGGSDRLNGLGKGTALAVPPAGPLKWALASEGDADTTNNWRNNVWFTQSED
jgi:hypothetical protein